jgi:hypothetical protein
MQLNGKPKLALWQQHLLRAASLILLTSPLAVSPVKADVPLTRADIESILNRVELLPRGRTPRTARISDFMGVGDALRTAPASRAELRFNDGSLARVGERATFQFVPNTRNFRLSNGTVLLLVPPGQGRSFIQTPSAVTGIQGSAVVVRYDDVEKETLVMALTENEAGCMTVTDPDGEEAHSLCAGQLAIIDSEQVRILEFDLEEFYETSPLVEDLQLHNIDYTGDDATVQAVRGETLQALSTQNEFIEADATYLNPDRLGFADAGENSQARQSFTQDPWLWSAETANQLPRHRFTPPGAIGGAASGNTASNGAGQPSAGENPGTVASSGRNNPPTNTPNSGQSQQPRPVTPPPSRPNNPASPPAGNGTNNPPTSSPPTTPGGTPSAPSGGGTSGGLGSVNQPPVEPPVVQPPAPEPPVAEPPTTQPPVAQPPVTQPPTTQPPVTEPPASQPPVAEPPAPEPPVAEPPVTEPPAEPPVAEPPAPEPPVAEPPAPEPPVAEPPVAAPPVSEPPAPEPPVAEPPAPEPPVAEPPAPEPPVAEPPAPEPPVAEPPVAEPPAPEPPAPEPPVAEPPPEPPVVEPPPEPPAPEPPVAEPPLEPPVVEPPAPEPPPEPPVVEPPPDPTLPERPAPVPPVTDPSNGNGPPTETPGGAIPANPDPGTGNPAEPAVPPDNAANVPTFPDKNTL